MAGSRTHALTDGTAGAGIAASGPGGPDQSKCYPPRLALVDRTPSLHIQQAVSDFYHGQLVLLCVRRASGAFLVG